MKIRNKHDGTTIEAQRLVEEESDFFLRIVENGCLFDEAIFYKKNGWEKVSDTNAGQNDEPIKQMEKEEKIRELVERWLKKYRSTDVPLDEDYNHFVDVVTYCVIDVTEKIKNCWRNKL